MDTTQPAPHHGRGTVPAALAISRGLRAKMSLLFIGATALSVVALAAPPATAAPRLPATASVAVKVATVAKYGKILEDQAGLPLYYNQDNKPPSKWACTGACLTAWPALVLPKGQTKVLVGRGVTGIGTIKSPSGTQVTWHGQPLYTFIQDTSGKATGNGIKSIWHLARLSAVVPGGGIAY